MDANQLPSTVDDILKSLGQQVSILLGTVFQRSSEEDMQTMFIKLKNSFEDLQLVIKRQDTQNNEQKFQFKEQIFQLKEQIFQLKEQIYQLKEQKTEQIFQLEIQKNEQIFQLGLQMKDMEIQNEVQGAKLIQLKTDLHVARSSHDMDLESCTFRRNEQLFRISEVAKLERELPRSEFLRSPPDRSEWPISNFSFYNQIKTIWNGINWLFDREIDFQQTMNRKMASICSYLAGVNVDWQFVQKTLEENNNGSSRLDLIFLTIVKSFLSLN